MGVGFVFCFPREVGEHHIIGRLQSRNLWFGSVGEKRKKRKKKGI
jgi:hypothetical protein